MSNKERTMYYKTFIETADREMLTRLKEDIVHDKNKSLITLSQYITLTKLIANKKKEIKQINNSKIVW